MGPSKSSRALRITSSNKLAGAPGEVQSSISPKMMALTPSSFFGLLELPEHSIDLVGLGADVFEEEDLVFGLWFEGGTEEGEEDREASAIEGAAYGKAGVAAVGCRSEEAQALGFADFVGFAGEGGEEAGEVDSVFFGEVGGDHGSVEAGDIQRIQKGNLKSGEVAVAEEGFGGGRRGRPCRADRGGSSSHSRRGLRRGRGSCRRRRRRGGRGGAARGFRRSRAGRG